MAARVTTEMEYEERMGQLFELILYDKLSFNELRKKLSKEWGVTTRSVENMIAEARKRLKERFTQEQDEIIQEQLSRYMDLLKRARDSGNRRVERETLADINKLYGIEKAQKVDLTSNGEPITINISLSND